MPRRAPDTTPGPGGGSITIRGQVRSYDELRLLLSLTPCAGCGSHEVTEIPTYGGPGKLHVVAPCPACGTPRKLCLRMRYSLGSLPATARFELGGPEPSQVIAPGQFLAALDRTSALLVWEPEALQPMQWRENNVRAHRATTCLVELLKLIPKGTDAIPERGLDAASRTERARRPERFLRSWLTAERDRHFALMARIDADAPRVSALERIASPPPPPPRSEISSRTLEAHLQWVRRGRTGSGQLDVANVSVAGLAIGAKDLSWSRLERVVFDRADARFSAFDGADLAFVSMTQAQLDDCSFVGARLKNCDLLGASLALGKLDDVAIDGGRFDRIQLDRCLWRGACVEGASFREADFGDSRLDDATFVDCDMRGASFALHSPTLGLGTSRGARFERCDLRGTRWDGRSLAGALFIACRFNGAAGRPADLTGVTIERPDLSPDGSAAMHAAAAEVIALWGGIDAS